jgi:adenylosuccinate synthase
MTAWVVVDLGFGDAGKGTVTDWLVRTQGARLVVRWNGGAQAGHNVVAPDGRHHTFSQFGAGTLVPGVRTHLAEDVVVHPTALLVEARRLGGDALQRITIARSARVVTPFHQAAGRLRDLALRHGTCGVGVGETVRDALEHEDDVLRAGDLLGDPRARLRRVRERLRPPAVEHPLAEAEWRVLREPEVESRWLEAVAPVRELVVPDESLRLDGPVVLEGAQGVLLDEWRGFHPHTTWSDTTTGGAIALLRRHGHSGDVRRLGVLRTYLTRHGPGPFPSETRDLELSEPHNPEGGWQGAFRVGWPDAELLRYALRVSDVDGLAVTHMDRLRAGWHAAARYHNAELRPGAPRDLAHQERLTRLLYAAQPVLERVAPEGFLDWVRSVTGRPVWLTSHGPTAMDKRVDAMPGVAGWRDDRTRKWTAPIADRRPVPPGDPRGQSATPRSPADTGKTHLPHHTP